MKPPRQRLGQIDLLTKRVRMSASDYRRSASEFALACSVADALRRWCAPGWRWTHFPAGEQREHKLNAKGKRWSPSGERLKRMGMQDGWPDLQLFSPAPERLAHFMELKKLARSRLSEEQTAFAAWAKEQGYPHAIVHDLIEALAILRKWGVLRV